MQMSSFVTQVKKITSCVLLTIAFSGCGLFSQTEIPRALAPDSPDASFTVYLQKGGLGAAEFEQYKLLPIGVLLECGKVIKGRFNTEYQKVMSVNDDELASLRVRIAEYIQSYETLSKADIDSPGAGSGFADAGRCEVFLKSKSGSLSLETSVDWVERARSKASKELRILIEEIRSLSDKSLCGNQSFYGLKRGMRS